jgi:hydroxypyruvate isomerase
MKYSVCIDSVFEGKDFVSSLKVIKELGFKRFEFWTWWDKDVNAIVKAKEELGLDNAALCTRFISLVDPALRDDYITGLKETIEVAAQLNCKTIISQVGDELEGVPREQQHASLVDGLKEAASLVEKAGATLVFEPLNTYVDHKGYYLYYSPEAFEIVDEVGSGNVKVMFDIYHQQIMEGNLIPNITNNINKIGHFHAAGHPGRHELDNGEICYPEIFKAIDASGYGDSMGLEFFPKEDPADCLPRVLNWRR